MTVKIDLNYYLGTFSVFWKRSCASSRGSTELSISDTTGAGSRLAISMKHSTSSLLSDHLSDVLRIFRALVTNSP